MTNDIKIKRIPFTIARYYWEAPVQIVLKDIGVSQDSIIETSTIKFRAGWSFTKWGARRGINKAISTASMDSSLNGKAPVSKTVR